MRKGKLRLGILGTSIALMGIVAILLVTPAGLAFTTSTTTGGTLTSTSPQLTLMFRSVGAGGDCNDYGKGAPCNPCELSGSMTNPSAKVVDAVCSDVLKATGAQQSWHAYYYVNKVLDSGAININETSGTLYAGQSLQFIFGIEYGCAVGYNPEIVKIVGPHNSVEIGFGGCG